MGIAIVRHRRQRSCPDCGGRLRTIVWEQPALLWMHGHGYTVRTTLVACTRRACRYVRHASTTTIRPDT